MAAAIIAMGGVRLVARVAAALACCTLSMVSVAHGVSSGIATTSFPLPAQGCNFCHGGGVPPSIILECADCDGAPPVVAPLSVHEFKLSVFEIGLQDHAGLNVSSLLGTLSTGGAFAANTQAIAGGGGRAEITHTAPKQELGGVTEFSFLWTAPADPGAATLQAWANAVNFDGSTAGDAAAVTTLNVTVGEEAPTPTATPDVSPTPTSTPLVGCPPLVDPGCVDQFTKGLLLIKTGVSGKEKLVAKLLNGPALAQTDLGNPLDTGQGGTGTAYLLCVYDGDGMLAGGALVDRAGDTCGSAPCWRPIGRAPNDPQGPGHGYKYGDIALASDGIKKVLFKGGSAGTSKVIVKGKGAGLPIGLPAALQSSVQATVQLRSSDGICLTKTLTEITAQDSSIFKAK